MNEEKKSAKFNISLYMIKIDRLSAWILFITVITYAITGYGMTRGIISPELSRSLHLSYLGIIGLISFIIHTSWAIHLFFKRHGWWNRFVKTCLISFYIIIFLFFGWVHFFYQTPNIKTNNVTPTNTNKAVNTTTVSNEKIFTANTLQTYDGLNGKPAYVAIDGKVYDMTRVFRSGTHYGYYAGQDLSAAFHDKHPDSYLSRYPIVGTYQNN